MENLLRFIYNGIVYAGDGNRCICMPQRTGEKFHVVAYRMLWRHHGRWIVLKPDGIIAGLKTVTSTIDGPDDGRLVFIHFNWK